MIVLFLFNVGGYYLVFLGLRHQSNLELRARLDAEQYSREDLIELKLPVTLPYPLQQQGFQRVDGKFEYNGQFFKLVKQKMENDTLYIVCIRNEEEKGLVNAFRDYAKLVVDVPSTSKKSPTTPFKFLTDFECVDGERMTANGGWCASIVFSEGNFDLPFRVNPVFSPPPEV